jgi:peptide/nickel transport system permease protein
MIAKATTAATIVAGDLLKLHRVAPHDPYDLASLSLLDATDPPVWLKDGTWSYPLGTDNQGRDAKPNRSALHSVCTGLPLSLR